MSGAGVKSLWLAVLLCGAGFALLIQGGASPLMVVVIKAPGVLRAAQTRQLCGAKGVTRVRLELTTCGFGIHQALAVGARRRVMHQHKLRAPFLPHAPLP